MGTLKKSLIFTLCFLLTQLGGTGLCLADKKSKPAVATQDEVSRIRQQVEKLTAKNKVRIQLKSDEKITGRILRHTQDSVALQTAKRAEVPPREIRYSEIKTIQAEEKLSPGIKILGLVVTIAIVSIFAVVTHHRQ